MNIKDDRKLRTLAKKIKLTKLFGGKCNKCGYDKYYLLQFHHIDPSTKEFEIGRNDYRFSRLIKEANKCILLCPRCHMLEHIKEKVTYPIDRRRKTMMLNYKGVNACEKCKYSNNEGVLDFHHIDPSNKKFILNTARFPINNLSDNIKLELDKCIVLCRNCHREIHYDMDFHNTAEDLINSNFRKFKDLIKLDHIEIIKHNENKLSVTEIAKKYGVNKSTISTILKQHGFRKYKLDDIKYDKNIMTKMILEGHTNMSICELLGCHSSIVSRLRKKLNAAVAETD